MSTIDTTLLDLGRMPTMDELRSHFRKHDWTAMKLSEPEKRSEEKIARMQEIKTIMDSEYEKIVREKGLKERSKYYENPIRIQGEKGSTIVQHQGNPLLELRDSTEDLVSDAVYALMHGHDDILNIIFQRFDPNTPDFDAKADRMMHNAVDTMLNAMEYDKLAKVVHEMSDFEDFNQNIRPNYRAEDHAKKWNHTNTKHPTLPDPDLEESVHDQNPNAEEKAIMNIVLKNFLEMIDEKDRTIVGMLMQGYTQKEIADRLGFSGNSAVSKRVDKLKKQFMEMTGMKAYE